MKEDIKDIIRSMFYGAESIDVKLQIVSAFLENITMNKKLTEIVLFECFEILYGQSPQDKLTVKAGYGGYKNRIEKWMLSRLTNKYNLTPSAVASEFRELNKIPTKMMPLLISIAQKAKNRLRMRQKRGNKIESIADIKDMQTNNEKQLPGRVSVTYEGFGLHSHKEFRLNEKLAELCGNFENAQIYWSSYLASTIDHAAKIGINDTIFMLFECLIKYGDCPSIGNNIKYDREANDFQKYHKLLSMISLIEHVFTVMSHAINTTKTLTFTETVYIILEVLCHDIGKIYLNDPRFKNMDHARISFLIAQEILRDKRVWEGVYNLILLHHEVPTDAPSELLRYADGMARTYEISYTEKYMPRPDIVKWFDMDALFKTMAQKLNKLDEGRPQAFTNGSIAYFSPNCLLKSARELAETTRSFDSALYRSSDKSALILEIIERIKKEGIVVGNLKEKQYGRRYNISFKRKDFTDMTLFLLPLKIERFGTPSELERKKRGYLRLIERVYYSG